MKLPMIIATIALAGCVGVSCVTKEDGDTAPVESPENVSYLCVGMEYSSRFGSCSGCAKDANNLASLMKNTYGYKGTTLISSDATKARVVQLLRDGVANTPEDGLFLFFYSGHGGQECLGGDEPEGSDEADEYLCLYDTYMLDDEIWNIVSTCKGRVFLYFDACHSATLYRSVTYDTAVADLKKGKTSKAKALGLDKAWIKTKGFTFKPENFVGATALSADNAQTVRLLCWSGCKESEYSYGSSRGGTLTQSVIGNWSKGKSYEKLWQSARSQVVNEQPGQNPVATHVGGGFEENLEAFK